MVCSSRPGAGRVTMTGADGLLPALHQGRAWSGAWPPGLSEHLDYEGGASKRPERAAAPGGGHAQDGGLARMGPFETRGAPEAGPGPSPRAR